MRAFLRNGCAKGCFIYVVALVLILMITSVGLRGLGAKFGAAEIQGVKPDLSVPQAGQDVTALQSQLASVNQDGFSGELSTPTPVPRPPTAVPQPPQQASPQPTSAPPAPAQGQGGTITGETSPPFYIVQPGDSLWSISQKFGVDLDTLRSLNNITGDTIYPGQIIYLPTGTQGSDADTASGAGSGGVIDQVQSVDDSQSAAVPSMPDTGITSMRP